ncbi:MAG: DUF86 domain-containing protein [Cyanobacteria bacterium]|uniref:HepT-like ribonuclease domain-containing protein n=1 Tax=Geminocystis sp. TaxID=2664100 RepID=UPI001D1EC745|nr:DUF86 domain-containing protein [Cyanobacteria bacterium CG_2015-16_32_12]NCO78636.1 DUF86 domain-containing protein [Cyanobacteria bacterium CG_2015-22_32_23]NCQ03359.1 DUF86 domain-containing protein [Cyanobacteria bacterium CG_2015-09_32_10]NCQ41820.1 DUF86 domain-containing protein [Cyanobacteria bacterium CG_2015-04_32_10]NCS85984.1 DUF86 domain-containing protein [Cyanobacteria bacterium CG_2015-02_32_10]
MSLSVKVYLCHIADEIDYLLDLSAGLEKDSFLEDKTLKRSFVRSLEIIGEATKKLPNDFRKDYSHIPWKQMAGMRDKLIHEYFGVDYDLVWNVIIYQIPLLHQQIQDILNREK